MKTFLQQMYDTFIVPVKDYRVLGWTLLVGFAASIVDPQGLKIIGMVLYVLFYWSLALFVRKIMFPYRRKDGDLRTQIKLSDFFKEALKGNIAAAIMGSTIVFMMCAVAYSFMSWMR